MRLATVLFLPKPLLLMFLAQKVQAESQSPGGSASRPGALPRPKSDVLSCFPEGYRALNERRPLLLSFRVQAQKPYIKQFFFILKSAQNIYNFSISLAISSVCNLS